MLPQKTEAWKCILCDAVYLHKQDAEKCCVEVEVHVEVKVQ